MYRKQIYSSSDIDLSNLSNITDAQLKAAADILAATMNAGKTNSKSSSISELPIGPPPEALMPPQQQPQQNSNYAYQQGPPPPLMSTQPQPPHPAAAFHPAAAAGVASFPPTPQQQPGYHNPAPPMNLMSGVNPGGHSALYFPHPGGPPPMSGPPPMLGPPPMSGLPPMSRGGPMLNQQNPYGKVRPF